MRVGRAATCESIEVECGCGVSAVASIRGSPLVKLVCSTIPVLVIVLLVVVVMMIAEVLD